MDSVWANVCKGLRVPDPITAKWAASIVQKYKSTNRVYHNENMLLGQIALITKERQTHGNTSALILAKTFQYYEFDPKCDMAAQNRQAFSDFMEECGKSIPDEQDIKAKVLALLGDGVGGNTAEPNTFQEDEFNFYQDLDLVVLGYVFGDCVAIGRFQLNVIHPDYSRSAPAEYDTYTQQLRQEFIDLDQSAYNKMRLKVDLNCESTIISNFIDFISYFGRSFRRFWAYRKSIPVLHSNTLR